MVLTRTELLELRPIARHSRDTSPLLSLRPLPRFLRLHEFIAPMGTTSRLCPGLKSGLTQKPWRPAFHKVSEDESSQLLSLQAHIFSHRIEIWGRSFAHGRPAWKEPG